MIFGHTNLSQPLKNMFILKYWQFYISVRITICAYLYLQSFHLTAAISESDFFKNKNETHVFLVSLNATFGKHDHMNY